MLSEHGNLDTGILRYMELTDLKFIPRRMYYITDTPKGEIRGKHGHYEDQQYLFCIKGQINVELYSKNGVEKVSLNPGESVFLDRMVWAQQEYVTGDDIMLVLCSTAFNKEDYFYQKEGIYNDKTD